MNNISANQIYSNTEFDTLLSEPANNSCFDCGQSPASWASVNNSIYLCLNCAGNHRSFGVNVSYIRSITIDTWNEAQIRHMKVGGNKRLSDLLAVYEVPKNILPEILYTTKLLEYHRGMIKSDVNNTPQLVQIKMEEALQPMEFQNRTPNPNSQSKYQSVSSSNDFDQVNQNQSSGFLSSMSSAFSKVVDTGKYYATNVKDKVVELDMNDIKSKIQTVGAKGKDALVNAGQVVKDTTIKGVDLIKDKSGNVISKGIEIGGIVKEKGTEFVKNEKVQSIAGKVGSGLSSGFNFVKGKLFSNNNQDNINQQNHSENIKTGTHENATNENK